MRPAIFFQRFAIALVTITSLLLPQSAAQAETAQVGNRQIEFFRAGDGPATVVFEAGLGDTMETWLPVADVAGFARIFAYNRPGYGNSRPKLPRPDAANVARNLHDLLVSTQMPKPWVLVGHSIGGAYMMSFAKLYPDEVKAVVLVDGTPPGQTEMIQREFPDLFRKLSQITPQLAGAGHDEFVASFNGGREFDAVGPFPRVPVDLLRKSQWDPSDSPEFRARVLQMQQVMLALSPCGVDQEVPGAGHYVHRDRPDVVIATIRTAVESDGCR